MAALQVWELGGKGSTWSADLSHFFNGVSAVLLVADGCLPDIEWDVEGFLTSARKHISGNVPIILALNKRDHAKFAHGSTPAAEAFVRRNGLEGWMETSARDGTNVERVFDELVEP